MQCEYSKQQMQQLISLKVTQLHSIEIDESTRLQSADPKWHKIRKERITASNAGEIVKRRADMISILLNFLCINPTFTFFNERKVVLSVT